MGFVDEESCVLPSVLAAKEGRAHKDCGEGERGVHAAEAEDARMLRGRPSTRPPTISPLRTHAHTAASASIRQHTAICPPPASPPPTTISSFEEQRSALAAGSAQPEFATLLSRGHTSASASIRQHTSNEQRYALAGGSAQPEFATSSSTEHPSASASIRQHPSEFARPFIRDEAVESSQQIDANGSGGDVLHTRARGGDILSTPPSSESGESGLFYEDDFEDFEGDFDFEDVEKDVEKEEEEEREEESGGADTTMYHCYTAAVVV